MVFRCPDNYSTRFYAGPGDHAAMARVLSAHRSTLGDGEIVSAEQIDNSYANLSGCDPYRECVVIEHGTSVVGYARTGELLGEDGETVHFMLIALDPEFGTRSIFDATADHFEAHIAHKVAAARESGDTAPHLIRTWSAHPGADRPLRDSMSAWLEDRGYVADRFGAAMVRAQLNDIPTLSLPADVEVRPTAPDQLRAIWDASCEAFRGSWGEAVPTEADWRVFRDDPSADLSLWRVAWHGDQVVGQIRSYITADENERYGRRRGYTENISTHPQWRRQGIASALLAASLTALAERGMTEAALGVDTDNPANALAMYQRMGFDVRSFEAVYQRPVTVSDRITAE